MFLFIRHYREPLTGGHYRYERLIRYAETLGGNVHISPNKLSVTHCDSVVMWSRLSLIPSVTMRLFFIAILLSFRLIKYRGKVKKIVVFGETTSLAALYASFVLSAPIYVGVRSNVRELNSMIMTDKPAISRSIHKLKFVVLDFILRLFYRKSKQIIVQTDEAKINFIRQYKINKELVKVVNNDLPLSFKKQFKGKPNHMHDFKNLLFIGNSGKIKGLDILVAALLSLPSSVFTKVTFVGVTESDIESLLLHGVNATAITRTQKISRIMLTHDLLIVPSRDDQFPNVVLEALAIGLPVIGADVSGIKYILKDKRFLFQPGSSEALKGLLLRLSCSEYCEACFDNLLIQRTRFDFCWETKYFNTLNNNL